MKAFAFRVLIVIDYMFNVLTGGGLQTTFSTRSYYNSVTTKKHKLVWVRIRKAVDIIMLEKDHCLKSYAWELQSKQDWIDNHKDL